jgi:hypothetical protein
MGLEACALGVPILAEELTAGEPIADRLSRHIKNGVSEDTPLGNAKEGRCFA